MRTTSAGAITGSPPWAGGRPSWSSAGSPRWWPWGGAPAWRRRRRDAMATIRPRVPAWADRVYAALLRTYPESFRAEYAGEMRAAFRSRWREQRPARRLIGVAGLWLAVLGDTLATAVRSQGEMLSPDLRYA